MTTTTPIGVAAQRNRNVSITGAAGVTWGHTFTPDPTGRYAVAETEYQYQPLRIFDLKPGLDGEVKTISRPIGAWANSWDGNAHNHEVRWPYVFVAGYMDGLQVFNMMDPTNPYTVGYYYTCDCLLPAGKDGAGELTFTTSDEEKGVEYTMLFDEKWASKGSMTYTKAGDETRVTLRMTGQNE